MNVVLIRYLLSIVLTLSSSTCFAQEPRVVVFVIIDALSNTYVQQYKPFLHGGIRYLLDNGIVYLNAFYQSATPGTCSGHTMLSTGTYAYQHGIINNKWFDERGREIPCDADFTGKASVFKPDGSFYEFGRSPKNTLVDGLSDQLMLLENPEKKFNVWALSLKSRAAIPMASHLGKAVWFDERTGNFTSSKAYFQKLPDWLTTFNKQKGINQLTHITWRLFYPANHPAYQFKHIHNYMHTKGQKSIINEKIAIDKKQSKSFERMFAKSPKGNQALIDLAKTCFDQEYSKDPNKRLFIWLSLSSLDKLGHKFGPQSQEAVDMLYHMDHQLGNFIHHVHARVNPKDILFVFTADHGSQPIPENLASQGFSLSRRYVAQDLIKEMNDMIRSTYGVRNIIRNFDEPQFYLNKDIMRRLTPKTQQEIIASIKTYLEGLEGIARAWSFDELCNKQFDAHDIFNNYKRQLFKNRSGDIIYAVRPYTLIDNNRSGSSHNAPYAYDMHVPLILYQKGVHEKRKIMKNVSMTQVAPTLATLLQVPRPSASTASVLPGLNKAKPHGKHI